MAICGLSPVAMKDWPKSVYKNQISKPVTVSMIKIPAKTASKYWGKDFKKALLKIVLLLKRDTLDLPMTIKSTE